MPSLVRLKPERKIDVRRERLAVNLADTDRIDPAIRGMMLAGKLDLSAPIRTDPDRIDESAVAFSCDLLTAACILDTLRSHDRSVGDYLTRCYLSRSGNGWTKLGGSVVLTRVIGERVVLDPVLFPPDVRPDEILAKPPERVEL